MSSGRPLGHGDAVCAYNAEAKAVTKSPMSIGRLEISRQVSPFIAFLL
jgi:hypothetical protein